MLNLVNIYVQVYALTITGVRQAIIIVYFNAIPGKYQCLYNNINNKVISNCLYSISITSTLILTINVCVLSVVQWGKLNFKILQ